MDLQRFRASLSSMAMDGKDLRLAPIEGDVMGAIRKVNTHLPPRLFAKHGAFWYVSQVEGKQIWQSLGRHEADAIARAYKLNEMKRMDRLAVLGRVRVVERKLREELMGRGEYRCAYCGAVDDLGIDHVIPYSAGGATEAFNLVVCCNSCNTSKLDRDPREFMLNLLGVRQALIDRAIFLLDKTQRY